MNPVTALLEKRLVVVTGKGGAGKTVVATALGLAAVAAGRDVLVCELGGQARVPSILGAALRPHLRALTIDPQAALEEWLRRRAGAPAVAALRRSRGFAYFVAAAPGAGELLTVGQLVDLAGGDRLVIVDAAATGHALAMLAAPRTYGEIAPVGRIARESRAVRAFLADPTSTGYVGVALPEAMSSAEALELEAALPGAAGQGLDMLVVDGVHRDRFSDHDAARMRALTTRGVARGLLGPVLAEHRRARRQAAEVAGLRARARAPVIELPFVFAPPSEAQLCERLALELAGPVARSARRPLASVSR